MSVFSSRLARLRRLLGRDAGVFLVTHRPNLLYLTGFRGSSGVLAVTRRSAVLFVPPLYRLQARQEVVGATLRVAQGDPLRGAVQWLRRRRIACVAFEPGTLTVAQFRWLQTALGPETRLSPAGRWVEALRAVKDEGEVSQIGAALSLTARVFNEVLPLVRPGVRELDLAAEIDYRMKIHGARGPAFETIVASGPRSALPHGRASRKRLTRNELVIFDLGAILGDYQGDMTRTVYLGSPPARVRRLYRSVQAALERARQAVKAGAPLARVDAAARRLLAGRGLGGYFIHGTGHGLGLEVHEEPRVSAKVDGSLEAGNVITLEPGVYLPGWGGIRIEDVVVVRSRGAENLTPLSTELICL